VVLGVLLGVGEGVELGQHADVRAARVPLLFERALLDLDLAVGAEDPVLRVVERRERNAEILMAAREIFARPA
jgi:hypothetical protein